MRPDIHRASPTSPWSPYDEPVSWAIEHCTDYLGRIRHHTADRYYAIEKSMHLHDAVTRLCYRLVDVDVWLSQCDAEFDVDESDGSRFRCQCNRPRSHPGGHAYRAERHGSRLRRLAAQLHDIAKSVDTSIGRMGADLDKGISPDGEQIDHVVEELEQLRRRAAELAGAITNAATSDVKSG